MTYTWDHITPKPRRSRSAECYNALDNAMNRIPGTVFHYALLHLVHDAVRGRGWWDLHEEHNRHSTKKIRHKKGLNLPPESQSTTPQFSTYRNGSSVQKYCLQIRLFAWQPTVLGTVIIALGKGSLILEEVYLHRVPCQVPGMYYSSSTSVVYDRPRANVRHGEFQASSMTARTTTKYD